MGFTKSDEGGLPLPRITISPFRMGATPVTWGIWKEYCKAESIQMPHSEWGYPDNHPVVNVSWGDIMNPGGFCEWASRVAGFKLTLPSDAQWEYAARGGRDGLDYPWGNDFDNSKLWCRVGETGKGLFSTDKTAAVDRPDRIYRNGYGLTDMLGNVYQWCADYYSALFRIGMDPLDTDNTRAVRGGSWNTINPDNFRCGERKSVKPDNWYNNVGFRLSAGQK